MEALKKENRELRKDMKKMIKQYQRMADRKKELGEDEGNAFTVFEPRREKTCLRDFRPGQTQTGLYSHRRWLDA